MEVHLVELEELPQPSASHRHIAGVLSRQQRWQKNQGEKINKIQVDV